MRCFNCGSRPVVFRLDGCCGLDCAAALPTILTAHPRCWETFVCALPGAAFDAPENRVQAVSLAPFSREISGFLRKFVVRQALEKPTVLKYGGLNRKLLPNFLNPSRFLRKIAFRQGLTESAVQGYGDSGNLKHGRDFTRKLASPGNLWLGKHWRGRQY